MRCLLSAKGVNYLMIKLYKSALIILLFFLSCTDNPVAVEHGIFAPSRLKSVIGQDGVCPIDFGDNITLWTFGDTITGTWKNDKGLLSSDQKEAIIDGMISNSIAWSEKITENNYKDIPFSFYKKNGRVKQFITNNKDEDPLRHRLWAFDGFRYKDRVYVFYAHIFVPDYREFLNFEVLYTGIARWDIPQGWKIGDDFNFKRLGILFEKGSPFFGAGVMIKDDDIYLVGHFKKGKKEFPISIAKANIDDVVEIISDKIIEVETDDFEVGDVEVATVKTDVENKNDFWSHMLELLKSEPSLYALLSDSSRVQAQKNENAVVINVTDEFTASLISADFLELLKEAAKKIFEHDVMIRVEVVDSTDSNTSQREKLDNLSAFVMNNFG
jgi:hypothetical protein